ncbi:unnamed protein product, partial [Ectocarpus sp. 12 AP-2014]
MSFSISSPPPPESSPLTLATLAEQLVLLLLPFAICTLVGQERLSTSHPRRRHDLSAWACSSIRRMRWSSAANSSSLSSFASTPITSAGNSPPMSVSSSSAPQRSRSSTPVTLEFLQAVCSGVSL